MRIFNKELLPQNNNHVARPSVLITVRRWMPRQKRYTVSAWSGWPMDNRMHHGGFMCKNDAITLANKLASKYS